MSLVCSLHFMLKGGPFVKKVSVLKMYVYCTSACFFFFKFPNHLIKSTYEFVQKFTGCGPLKPGFAPLNEYLDLQENLTNLARWMFLHTCWQSKPQEVVQLPAHEGRKALTVNHADGCARHGVNGLHVHTYRHTLKSCLEVCNGLDPLIIPGTALSSRSAQADETTAAGT